LFLFPSPKHAKKQWHNIHIENKRKKGNFLLKIKKNEKKTRENKPKKNLKLGW
jgi:hypothetical protein